MINKKITILLLALCAVSSCINYDHKPVIPISEDFFNWETIKKVKLSVTVDPLSGDINNYYRTVKVFSSSLFDENSLMATGSALPDVPYTNTIIVPDVLNMLYIEVIAPDGVKKQYSLDITELAEVVIAPENSAALTKAEDIPAINVPDWGEIPSSFTKTFTSDITTNTTLNGNKTFYVPAGYDITSYVNGVENLNFWNYNGSSKNAAIYIAGKLTVSSVNINCASIVVLDGGELVVTGTFTTANVSTSHPQPLYVMAGGKVTFEEGLSLERTCQVVNKGEMVIGADKSITMTGYYTYIPTFYNTGIIHSTTTGGEEGVYPQDISINLSGCAILHNDGDIHVSDLSIPQSYSFITKEGVVYNYANGTINAVNYTQDVLFTHLQVNRAYTYNYGNIITNDFFVKGNLHNYGYIEVSNEFDSDELEATFYEGSLLLADDVEFDDTEIYLKDGSIISFNTANEYGDHYTIYNDDEGYSLIIVNNSMYSLVEAESHLEGNIEVWHKELGKTGNTLEDYTPNCDNTVRWVKLLADRVVNIPESAYNKGLGVLTPVPVIEDKDGDGVFSDVDIDDNDPTIAYRSYFPNNSTFGTIMFEDLWPYTGDYDMNDIVCDFKLSWTSNAQNEVVYMEYDWKLRAAGTTQKIAMAFQIDSLAVGFVQSSQLTHTPEGTLPMTVVNGMESGQTYPVIPLFNDPAEIFGISTLVNTIPDYPYYPSVVHNCKITFTSPLDYSDVSLDRINNFIIVTDFDNPVRSWEVHMPGFKKTSLASSTVNNQSGLSQNDPYLSNTGMMWGIMTPKSIDYPVETYFMETVYLHYREWYISKGTSYQNWYEDLSGYIDKSRIYIHR